MYSPGVLLSFVHSLVLNVLSFSVLVSSVHSLALNVLSFSVLVSFVHSLVLKMGKISLKKSSPPFFSEKSLRPLFLVKKVFAPYFFS